MDVIIVCHTEFGRVKNKEIVYDKSSKEGVTIGVPNLMKVAERYGARVTFAVMPEVAEYFPKGAEHEVGLHIHPGWEAFNVHGNHYDVGDAYLRGHCKMSSKSSVLKDHCYLEQLMMITAGRDYISKTLGVKPLTFVAGRWSINNDTVKALINIGFTHECSAAPHKKPRHYDWSKLSRICMPYHPSVADYQEEGDLPLLMLPISQTLLGASVSPEIIPTIGREWLESCFLEYYRQQLPFFHICLHSPCMTDPYFIEQTEALIRFISTHDVSFKKASEITKYGRVDPKASVMPYVFGLNANLARTCADRLLHSLPMRSSPMAVRR